MGLFLFRDFCHFKSECVDVDETRVPYDVVASKAECMAKNLTWTNSRINFDNVLNAYLALFQVATFNGWEEIMADARDMGQEVSWSMFLNPYQ